MNPLSAEATPLLRTWLETGSHGGDAVYQATGRFGPPPRRPFERAAVVWGLASSFLVPLAALLLAAAASPPLALWLRAHDPLLAAVPYGLAAGVFFGACVLPLPRAPRVPRFGPLEFAAFALLAAVWGVCVALALLRVRPLPPVLRVALPVAAVYAVLEGVSAAAAYLEGRRRAQVDPFVLVPASTGPSQM